MYKSDYNAYIYNKSTVPLSMVSLVLESGPPQPHYDYSFSVSVQNGSLVRLTHLPPLQIFRLVFRHLVLHLFSDANGVYEFIEPLPLSILSFNASIQFEHVATDIVPYPYSSVFGYYRLSDCEAPAVARIKTVRPDDPSQEIIHVLRFRTHSVSIIKNEQS